MSRINRTARIAVLSASVAVACGCRPTFKIKLDPGDDGQVFVDGALKGSGVVVHEVPEQYGLEEKFSVRVMPGSGQEYSVLVSRKHDDSKAWTDIVLNAGAGVVMIGLGLFWPDPNVQGGAPGTKTTSWVVDRPYAIGLGAAYVLISPLLWFRNYGYSPYYSLPALREAQSSPSAASER